MFVVRYRHSILFAFASEGSLIATQAALFGLCVGELWLWGNGVHSAPPHVPPRCLSVPLRQRSTQYLVLSTQYLGDISYGKKDKDRIEDLKKNRVLS